MPIQNQKGELVCTCTECGHEEYGGVLDFKDFINWLKEQGWQIGKDGETWTHTCPDCQ